MDNSTLPISNDQRPALFEYAFCASYLITIVNPNGAAVYTSQSGNYILRNPATNIAVGKSFTSLGYSDDRQYYNTNQGWLKAEDISLSTTRNFENTLVALKGMVMHETWEYSKAENRKPLPILYNYLLHTFARIKEEIKIKDVGGYSCFNTGLVTENQEEVFMLFRFNHAKSIKAFQGFYKESANELSRFTPLPERASYFNNSSELIYDTSLELRVNIDHIVSDTENFSRFPGVIKSIPSHQLLNTFRGAVEHAKKRVKRNYLTAIPQYYRGKYVPSGQLQLLLPLCLIEPSKADLALAVYKNGDAYSGRTCLTLDMAINNARLITKPDDEWLRP